MIRMHRPVRTTLVSLLATILGLTACTGQPAHPGATSAPTSASKPKPPVVTTAWTYTQQRPMTRFVDVDGQLVGMTLRDKLLRVTSLDPSTGQVRWDQPASPGFNPPGVSPELLVLGKDVVYLQPKSAKQHYWTYVVVASARTGQVVTSTKDDYEVDGLPEKCGKSVCFDAYRDLGRDWSAEERWVLNPVTGIVRSTGDSTDLATGDWRVIGDGGLIELNDGREVGRERNGKLLWRRSWRSTFGPDFTGSGGWDWEYDAKHHIFTGEVGWLPDDIRKRTENLATKSIMVGLDSRTGKLRWKDVGVSRFCDAVELLAEMPQGDEDYRCRYRSGVLDYRKGARTWLKNVGVTVERFNHVTDKSEWDVPLDPYSVSDNYAEPTMRLLDDHRLLGLQHKQVIAFDLRTGRSETLPATVLGWCGVSDEVAYANSPYQEAGKFRDTATLLMSCRKDGKQAKITTMPPKSLSATVGDVRVVTGLHSVTGLRYS